MIWFGLAFAGEWRVAETPHYRVHYPVEAEGFALRATSQLEAVRDRVATAVGFRPGFKTQIVIRDPYGVSNGLTIPLGRSPRVELWATPAKADSPIGHVYDWTVDLTLHEDLHTVHLLKPPRALSGQILYWFFNIAPIGVKSPRWMIEGYATAIEGSETGAGRPHSDFRATLLRQLASAGELPTYEELNWSDRWMGPNFAYQVGSAYVEWLERRKPGSIHDLWARMTARHERNFAEAFQGTYGDRPSTLYKRFCAELTAAAMDADAPPDTLWMYTAGDVSAPTVTPDGSLLAVVIDPVDGPPALTVIETAIDEKRVERRNEKIERILHKDPEDARAVDPRAPPHKVRRSWVHRSNLPQDPRWLDDDTLLYTATVADGVGNIRRDVFRWDLDRNPKRLTRNADVIEVDAQAGRIIGLTSRWGETALVEIAPDGSTTPLLAPSAERVLDTPRLSPDGSQIAYLRNEGLGWRVWILDDTGEHELDLPEDWQVRQLAWGDQGLLGSVGVGGRIDLFNLEDGGTRLTTSGAAFAPEPNGDDLFHLELSAHGYRIHRMDSDVPGRPVEDAVALPAGRVEPMEPVIFARQPVEGRKMGLGRLESRVLIGGTVGSGSNLEAGLRLGDIVGRNQLAVMGSLGDAGGMSGGAAWWANRTLPVHTTARVWALRDGVGPTVRLGGSLLAGRTRGTTAVVGELAVGAFGETGRAAGHGSAELAWIEPQGRFVQGSFGIRGLAGWESGLLWQGEGHASVRLGSPVFFLEGEAALGFGSAYGLGGVPSGLRAEAAQWDRVQPGWIRIGTDSGTQQDQVKAAIGRGQVSVFAERIRIDGRPYSIAGLQVVQEIEAEPMLKMPRMTAEMGIGCNFEANGIVDRYCRKLSDYRVWSSLTWHP